MENLLAGWREFVRGKRNRCDVQIFESRLLQNIIGLHKDLKNGEYRHGGYEAFRITDPKPRDIHKASVRDRLVHHAVYRILYPYFSKVFTADSYSCQDDKGTYRAIIRFEKFIRKVSKNGTGRCLVLKCDIKKFFASIDHQVLKKILAEHIVDADVLCLLDEIINSFNSIYSTADIGKGLPLGNLTSQLLVNIYMNEFDRFVKHNLGVKYYIRYADDFVVLGAHKEQLFECLEHITRYLGEELRLLVHPDKVFVRAIYSGVDFLGWVHFAKHRVIRTKTKKRMFRNIKIRQGGTCKQSLASYLGMLKWGNGHKVRILLE